MFSKKDVEHYLKQMDNIEIAMQKGYQQMALEVKDPKLKKIFELLAIEEQDHQQEFYLQ